jgi:hypothetical protein
VVVGWGELAILSFEEIFTVFLARYLIYENMPEN